jgi:hypothetical protein
LKTAGITLAYFVQSTYRDLRIMKFLRLLLVLFFSSTSFTSLLAVVVQSGTASNLTAPADDPGWAAVATITAPAGPASAIFLGNVAGFGWFLTANHVSLGNATLTIGGNPYTNFAGIDRIGSTDMKVFRVDAAVAANTPVTLASNTPAVGSPVVMIGFGATGAPVTWNTANATWISPGANASGYDWTGPSVKQWGNNQIHEKGSTFYSPNISIITDFDNTANEGQGSLGDSGGAVFFKNGSNWELIGLMVAVGVTSNGTTYGGAFVGQPGSTSVSWIQGNPNAKSVTFSAEISQYRTEILQAIPEVSSLGLLALGALLLYRRNAGGR